MGCGDIHATFSTSDGAPLCLQVFLLPPLLCRICRCPPMLCYKVASIQQAVALYLYATIVWQATDDFFLCILMCTQTCLSPMYFCRGIGGVKCYVLICLFCQSNQAMWHRQCPLYSALSLEKGLVAPHLWLVNGGVVASFHTKKANVENRENEYQWLFSKSQFRRTKYVCHKCNFVFHIFQVSF